MKKHLFLIAGVMIFAAQSVLSKSPELGSALKQSGEEPGVLQIIFSLVFVILLIYITGIIYSKLNVASAKKIKEQFKAYDLYKAVIISTTQLGQGKNLHVIELNNKYYLIGATSNSISLIKELTDIKEIPDKNDKVEKEEDIDKAIQLLYNNNKDKFIEKEEPEKEQFDIHKKYL